MEYYHHQSIKKYTIALLELFSDFYIQRYNEDGSIQKEIQVPIKFGNREKAFILQDFNSKDLINGNINYLPRMVLEFNSLTRASTRNTNKNAKIKFQTKTITDSSGTSTSLQDFFYNSVAYDFTFTLYIATKGFTDATVIIEQIAPLFRPDVTMKIQELDFLSSPTSVQVSISDFDIEMPDINDEPKIVKVSVPITLKGNLYLPIKDSKIIEDVKVQLKAIQSDFDRKGALYEVEEDAYLIEENLDSQGNEQETITQQSDI